VLRPPNEKFTFLRHSGNSIELSDNLMPLRPLLSLLSRLSSLEARASRHSDASFQRIIRRRLSIILLHVGQVASYITNSHSFQQI